MTHGRHKCCWQAGCGAVQVSAGQRDPKVFNTSADIAVGVAVLVQTEGDAQWDRPWSLGQITT